MSSDFHVDQNVEAQWSDGHFYKARITRLVPGGKYAVLFTEYSETAVVTAQGLRPEVLAAPVLAAPVSSDPEQDELEARLARLMAPPSTTTKSSSPVFISIPSSSAPSRSPSLVPSSPSNFPSSPSQPQVGKDKNTPLIIKTTGIGADPTEVKEVNQQLAMAAAAQQKAAEVNNVAPGMIVMSMYVLCLAAVACFMLKDTCFKSRS